MFIPFFRFSGVLTGPLASTDSVIPADLSAIVLPNTGDYTRLVISNGSNFEVVKLARNGSSVVVSRAQEGTAAQAFPAGSGIAYENTPQNILDTERPCADRYVPIAPVTDGIYQNATVRVQNGVITQVQGGTNVIVSQCDECDEVGGSTAFAATNTINPVPVGTLQGFDLRISEQSGNLLAQDGNGARVTVSYQNSDTVAWSGNGLPASPLRNNVRVSGATGNLISINADGIFSSAPPGNGAQAIMDSDDIRIVGGSSSAQLFLAPTGVSPDGSDIDVGGMVFDEDGRLRTIPSSFNPPRSITSANDFITADTAAGGAVTLTYNGTIVPVVDNVTIDIATVDTERRISLGSGAVVSASPKLTVVRNATTGVLTLDANGRTPVNTDGTFLIDLLSDPNEARFSAGPRTLNGRTIFFNSTTSWQSNGIDYNGTGEFTVTDVNFSLNKVILIGVQANGVPIGVSRAVNAGTFTIHELFYDNGSGTPTIYTRLGPQRAPQAGDSITAVLLA